MRTLLTCCVVISLASNAAAQNASPAGPVPFRVIATGGFLGQLDGFCEQPGGTYDEPGKTTGAAATSLQPCAEKTGAGADAKWPAVLGGVLGVRTRIELAKANGITPLVVLAGNNQVANFTFRNSGASDATVNYAGTPIPIDPKEPQSIQRKRRLWRFWQNIAALKPAAIGLGAEDFVRSLRDPRDVPGNASANAPDQITDVIDRGSIFQRWTARAISQGLPIIGTNVVIKMRGDHLNVVKSDDFSLTGIKENESTDWMSEIKVAHPSTDGITIALWESGAVGVGADKNCTDEKTCRLDEKKTDGKGTSTTLDPGKRTLKPGYRYRVVVHQGSKEFTLTFLTDSVLTPATNSHTENGTTTGYPELDGFPFVARELVDGSPILILSLVDQATKKTAGAKAWKWKRAPKACEPNQLCTWNQNICPADECEIDFTSPADAVKAAIVRAGPDSNGRKPIVVLLSALTDKQNEELLVEYPEIRIVVLDPDSYMIGRAAREFQKDFKDLDRVLAKRDSDQEYSGDRGMSAVMNHTLPQATSVVVRPEWIGETLADISGQVSYTARQEWELAPQFVEVEGVPGAALRWSPFDCAQDLAGDGVSCTEFFVNWPPGAPDNRISYGSFKSYLACEGKDLTNVTIADHCSMLASLGDSGEFLTFAADTLRRASRAELAIVPFTLVDVDAQAWLNSLLEPSYTRMLTRFVLERAIFRSFRIVRATVAGDKLLETIEKAFKSEAFVKPCVVGLATGCIDKVDAKKSDTTTVNGRAIDSRSFYTIAMPEGLAEELKLPYPKNRYAIDAVSAIHERLDRLDGGWYLDGREKRLAARIERRANRKLQYSLLTSALEYSYSKLAPDATLSDGNTLKALDVEFRSVKPARTHAWKTDVDWAIVDAKDAAVRAVMQLDFNRREDIKKISDVAISQLTYPNNSLLYGLRADVKRRPFGRELRTYVGRLFEREVQAPLEYLNASDKSEDTAVFTKSRTERRANAYEREPLKYHYWAVGTDYVNIKSFTFRGFPAWAVVDISRASLQAASGELINVPIGAEINGFRADFGTGGADAVLNAYYKQFIAEHPTEAFDTNAKLKARYDDPRRQQRLQAELNMERTFSIQSRDWKFGVELRYRYFPETSDSESDSLKRYWRTKASISLPVSPRIQVVPSIEWHRATIADPEEGKKGTFTYSKVELNLKMPFLVRAGWGWLIR